jgi:microcompartment protein CcmK/EutM
MFLADVIGTVVAPVQNKFLDGRKLLVLRPLTPDGRPALKTRVAIDKIGAGVGDRVICLDEGNGGRQVLETGPKGPVKTVVIGYVDAIELHGRVVYDHREATAPQPLRK